MKIPSYEEAVKQWQELEKYLVETRYAVRDNKGKPQEHTYSDVIERVISWITSEEVLKQCPSELHGLFKQEYGRIEEHLMNKFVVPASPVLMNAGARTRRKGYFSCFPLGYVEDSIEGIFSTASLMKDIYVKSGGAGVDVSQLRAKDSLVDDSQGRSSGPTAFLDIYGAVAGSVSQGGRRRGALLVQMSENHLDWKEFIRCKVGRRQESILSNMNISLNIENELKSSIVNEVADCIWECGDPGLFFIKNAYENTPIPLELEPRASNPCGEYLSVSRTACDLLSINVTELARRMKEFGIHAFLDVVFDAAYVATLIGTMIIFQREGYPSDEIRDRTIEYRPVGIGMLGVHGALMRLGYAYDELDSLGLQQYLALGTMEASADMIMQHNSPVPCNTKWMEEHVEQCSSGDPMPEGKDLKIQEALKKYGSLYNMVTTVQAPTGSISQLVHSATNGIEPLYAIETKRKVKDISKKGSGFVEFTLYPLELFDEQGKLILDPETVEIAHTISPKVQIDVMADIQKYCHTSVSKTVNLASSATKEEIVELIKYAYDKKLKAITFYRDRSKEVQILTSPQEPQGVKEEVFPVERDGKTYTIKGPRSCYITLNKVDGEVREVFVESGKSGTMLKALLEALGRVISVALRADGGLLESIATTLKGIDSGTMYTFPGRRFKSIPDALASFLTMHKTEQTGKELVEEAFGICPDCGKMSLRRAGGCSACSECGYSSC